MESLEQKLRKMKFTEASTQAILSAVEDWLTDHADAHEQERVPEWAAAVRFTRSWLKEGGYQETSSHECHDLQCATCGVEINNQCLDPNCDQDHPHSNGDAYCEEHLVAHAN